MPHRVEFMPKGKTVVILGAGFSKSLSSDMPLTNELGKSIISKLSKALQEELNAPNFENSELTFESWLSWLSEDQPYENESENLRRQSLFKQLQSRIADVVSNQQREAVKSGLPNWLESLIFLLHFWESTVITLNYDTLIESTVSILGLTDPNREHVQSSDLIKIFPMSIGMTFNGTAGPPRAIRTFELLKLHGSIDWLWNITDRSGTTLERVDREIGHTGIELKANRAAKAGKVEFIVPPTNNKNEYFQIPQIKLQWDFAYEALREAENVILLGYSMPINDVAMASLFRKVIAETESTFTIVNLDCDPVVHKISAMGVPSDRIRAIGGIDSIRNYVQEIELESAGWFSQRFEESLKKVSNSPIAVGWNSEKIAGVIDASFDLSTSTLKIKTGELGRTWDLHRPGTLYNGTTSSPYLVSFDILTKIPWSFSIKSVEVIIPNNGTWQVGGFLRDLEFVGGNQLAENQGEWLFLHPLGRIT